ncbi:MAG TPA: hypothetical protein VN841_14980 [Bryobacteraceae bacterium]|nr:hypothetical protein [Bryobacteraceae bacterium]
MGEVRLGDTIDDFCVKCKRLTNHAVVSLLNGSAAKVRCRTCYSDHDYRNEIAPPSKRDLKKAALFNQVLSSVAPAGDAAPVEVPPLVEEKPARKKR